MSFPTYAVSTELDAVNQILSSVGQAPVTTLDLENPEAAIAVNTLREISKQVQIEGWTFNTERGLKLSRDINTNKIQFPFNYLAIDANTQKHQDKYNLVRRNGFVYCLYHHTDIFTEDLTVDIVWQFDFVELPPAIQAYITAKAARMAATKIVGDGDLNQLLAEQEVMTKAAAIEYECQQGDYSMFGHRDEQNYYTSYQPFRALSRQ